MRLLKESSPSCGRNTIYDGSHSGKKISGMGLTAKLLTDNNIEVYTASSSCQRYLLRWQTDFIYVVKTHLIRCGGCKGIGQKSQNVLLHGFCISDQGHALRYLGYTRYK